MSDDIVTRLRDAWHNGDQDAAIGLTREAADEIERLSADRDRWKALGQHVCEFHSSLIPQYIHDLFDDYNKVVRGE